MPDDVNSYIPADFAMFSGVGRTLTPEDLKKYITKDPSLGLPQKTELLRMLDAPNVEEHLLAGATGAAIGLVLARYKKMSPSSQVLMSLAGFGIGNIILNTLTSPPKHTWWNSERSTNNIKL